jgi:23S rRNA pseudouridine955/2504/2580 synthase
MNDPPLPDLHRSCAHENAGDGEDAAADRPEAVCAAPIVVTPDEAGLRLDRWFRRRWPGMAHGMLERLLRTGQVRVDGHRVKAGVRLEAGQVIRVPPVVQTAPSGHSDRAGCPLNADEIEDLHARVLYRDAQVIVIDKPAGLAVQGGSKTTMHLDGMLDALRFDGERPRLVHRLDKDTSGVLLLARSANAAAWLARAFREGQVRKLYWAVVVGSPAVQQGRVSRPLSKRFGVRGERVGADDEGQPAVTDYRVVERAGRRAAWLELRPWTGRTHQLRAHCVELGTPMLGDGKYGGAIALVEREGEGAGQRLHLHARMVRFPNPSGGETQVTAPLPAHMLATFRFFGFSEKLAGTDLPDEVPPARRSMRTEGPGSSRRSPAHPSRQQSRGG